MNIHGMRGGSRFSRFPFRPQYRIQIVPWLAIKRHSIASGQVKDKLVRKDSAETGENLTGHITAGHNEGILFFDNVLPLFLLKLNWLYRLPGISDGTLTDLLSRYYHGTLSPFEPLSLVKRAIPGDASIKVIQILPRLKDGGYFVKFSHSEGVTGESVEAQVSRHLRENPVKPWFSPFRGVNTRLVLGRPWLEDLNRLPSRRLKVEFVPLTPEGEAAELSQESLYSLFRRYGKLADVNSQPSDSKILPKYAYVDFSHTRHAIMARNCMHGFKVVEEAGGGRAGTLLRLSFVQKNKGHWIWDWFVGHPRVSIPILAAIIATATVAIFDPIRTFFIKAHIDHAFHLTDLKIYKWFKSQATDILTFRHNKSEEANLSAVWDDRKKAINEMSSWLMDPADTFIVIQGPRGSGKRELVMDVALKEREDILYIDCKPIQEARGDSATIAAAAKTVGYRPIFSWMNSLSSFVDLAAQGTIGVKSGFSETLDTQLAKIWQNTAIALKQVALKHRKKDDKDASLSDDDWLEAHPERRPVVVIDNFLHKKDESSVVYDKISEWAARLTSSNIAHIIFLTNDTSYSKPLGKALPDRVFRQLALGDLSFENAKKFVITHLETNPSDPTETEKLTPQKKREDLEAIDDSVMTIGGRLTDLEFFARRLQTGQTPKQAVSEMVEQNASEVMKIYLLSLNEDHRKWSSEQAWYLIKALVEDETLRYNEVLLSNTFASSLTTSAGSIAALEALSASELISIKTTNGRPHAIKAGKPLYQAAFKALTSDKDLKSRFDLAVLKELAGIEANSIAKCEEELQVLGKLPRQVSEITPRVQYLLAKLASSQRKVEGWEKEMEVLKNVSVDA